MNRSGAALFVALVVVVTGGMITVLATMMAAAEIRAGTAWRDQQEASSAATAAMAATQIDASMMFDSLALGEARAVNDTVRIVRIGDSLALLEVRAESRAAADYYVTVSRQVRDSAGNGRLQVPRDSRARYHPVP